MITIYGIPNCDTIKKTLDWFKANKIDFAFHDYKIQGITKQRLQSWCKQVDWQQLFNKRSTTWKTINAAAVTTVESAEQAIAIMMEYHSIIKRPVIEQDGKIIAVGFNAAELANKLK